MKISNPWKKQILVGLHLVKLMNFHGNLWWLIGDWLTGSSLVIDWTPFWCWIEVVASKILLLTPILGDLIGCGGYNFQLGRIDYLHGDSMIIWLWWWWWWLWLWLWCWWWWWWLWWWWHWWWWFHDLMIMMIIMISRASHHLQSWFPRSFRNNSQRSNSLSWMPGVVAVIGWRDTGYTGYVF